MLEKHFWEDISPFRWLIPMFWTSTEVCLKKIIIVCTQTEWWLHRGRDHLSCKVMGVTLLIRILWLWSNEIYPLIVICHCTMKNIRIPEWTSPWEQDQSNFKVQQYRIHHIWFIKHWARNLLTGHGVFLETRPKRIIYHEQMDSSSNRATFQSSNCETDLTPRYSLMYFLDIAGQVSTATESKGFSLWTRYSDRWGMRSDISKQQTEVMYLVPTQWNYMYLKVKSWKMSNVINDDRTEYIAEATKDSIAQAQKN